MTCGCVSVADSRASSRNMRSSSGIERVLRQDALEHDDLLEALDADARHAREKDLRHAADGQAPDRLVPADALTAVDR